MDRLRSHWIVVVEAVDGLKTFTAAGIFFLLGAADYFDVVNVRPVLDYLIGPDKGAKIMTFLPLIFATLRFFTKDRPRWMQRWRHEDVPVDECNQPTEH